MRWRLGLLAVVALLALGLPGHAQDTQTVPEKPTLTVRLIPPTPYLQEQIIQTVRVVAADVFEELVLDLPPVEGADVITLQQPKTRKFATYGGEGYIYETRRAIFPRASGQFEIPPVRVSGSIAVGRDEREDFALRQEGVTLDIRPPPADFSEAAWLVARRVEIEEQWSKPLEELRVGDHVTRTVEAVATGVTGSHLPELDHGRSTGLTILPGQTRRSTEVTDDGVIGKIERSFEIRIDIDQPINISPVRVVWWNTDTEIEWRSVAKSVRIEPLPRDVEALVQGLMAEAEETHAAGRYGIMAMTGLGALGLILLLARLLVGRRQRLPQDQDLLHAVRANPTPLAAVSALHSWAGSTLGWNKPISLDRLRQHLGGNAAHHLEALQRAAFGQVGQNVDVVDAIRAIIAQAQCYRSRSISEAFFGLARSVVGPKQHLPVINARKSGVEFVE